MAVVAETSPAQAAFRAIQARWYDTPERRAELMEPLIAFIDRYPADDQVRLAMVYLAWIHVDAGDLTTARRLAARTRRGPSGSAHDLADVVEAAVRIRLKQPRAALELLLPLEGRLIDPRERAAYREHLALAWIASGRWREATAALIGWATETPADELSAVHRRIEQLLADAPEEELSRLLAELREADASAVSEELAREREWLRGVVVARLTEGALARGDAELAGRLLGERTPNESRERRAELARLAAASASAPSVQGRLVGLALSTGTALRRRRSAEVARGLTRALGLPKVARDEAEVRLISAADTGGAGAMRRALMELLGSGASLLVAGVDEVGAAEVLAFAQSSSVPIVLVEPGGVSATPDTVFVVGEGPRSRELLEREIARRGLQSARVDAELCDAAPARAGASRFPMGKWQGGGVTALLITGPVACAGQLALDLSAARYQPLLASDLEATRIGFEATWRGGRLSLRAHRFPGEGAADTWFAALGHDVGALARRALRELPLSTTKEAEAVLALHRQALAAFARAEATLQTTTARGFQQGRRLPRELSLVSEP
ncbi:MAG: hypothetical protein KIT72_04670 [Polyangiaceae bacterium]|nr:hypothetical protein [Polyangiaceae bacterium]MCW5789697.1 hypothetical protein [Polyangiaceae bacterium]